MRAVSLSILFLSFLLLHPHPAKAAPLAPAIYVFGDSLSDSGNNNFLQTLAKANYPPYGVDFASGPTGRFTNGKTAVDFIAEALGLPHAPPYMGLTPPQKSTTITGINYASGSAGILPESGRAIGKNLPLTAQLDFFQSTVETDLTKNFKTPQELSDYLAKSIFFVSIGGNDYINNYLQPKVYSSSKQFTPQAFAQLLAQKLSESLQRLHTLGARKIVVFEIGAIGCIPAVVNVVKHDGLCVDPVNQLISLYNGLLPNLLKQLQSQLPGSVFVHGSSFSLNIDLSKKTGPDLLTPCCVVAKNAQCVSSQPPCADRSSRIYYDSFHPTEAVNSIVASRCFGENSVCSPMNIKQLAAA